MQNIKLGIELSFGRSESVKCEFSSGIPPFPPTLYIDADACPVKNEIYRVAERYDLPEIQYWRMERGKANITLKSLSRILHIHRLTLHDFFCLMQGHKVAA